MTKSATDGPAKSGDYAAIRVQTQLECPACNAPGHIAVSELADRSEGIPGVWNVRECENCGCGWLDPTPITDDIGLCYSTGYYTRGDASGVEIPQFLNSGFSNALRRLVLNARYGYTLQEPNFPGSKTLGRLLGAVPAVRYRLLYRRDSALLPWAGGGRLLDIGCGGGQYLALARGLGWQACGLDPDPVAADHARTRSGAEVEVGTLQTTSYPPESFDTVVSLHSIEHAHDPTEFLRLAYRLLKPGGVLYLQTPNFASLGRRQLGPDWFPLEVPRHLCLLSPAGMRRVLGAAGSWQRMTVRTLPRRTRADRRMAIAVRRHGRFSAPVVLSARDRLGIFGWTLIERIASSLFEMGSELEVIARKSTSGGT